MKCATKGHRFQKFDEESLFCERCGERRVIAPAAQPWWGVIPPYPWQTYRRPYWWEVQPTYIWSDSTSVTSDNITVWNTDDAHTFESYPAGSSVSFTTNAIAGPQAQTPRGVKRT